LFLVLQQIEGNLIYPRVVGDSIGLPALWVLAAVMVGGNLFGVLGMLAGVPFAAVVYVLLRETVGQRMKRKKLADEHS
jgi:predicted PurR-regulated permease PerM